MSGFGFQGTTVLVTHPGSALSAACAQALAARGAAIAMPAHGQDAERLATTIRAQGGAALLVSGDPRTATSAQIMVEAASPDVVLVDPDDAGQGGGRLETIDPDRIAAMVAAGLMEAVWPVRAALPRMRARGYGRIVMVTTGAGAFGTAEAASISAAKAGIIGLAKAVALETRDGDIRVNAVSTEGGSDGIGPVLYLCHAACTLDGEVLSLTSGRIARIFVATAPGIFEPRLAAEAMPERLDAIMSPDGYIIPRRASDERILVDV
ncbi:MAG TPA: SDR family NAD(P)-dependent oxidoreductase [Vineibacter sp.]|nr:SDR family NAD(P)-dependent oxidoreductase [Vineibacter sp.]